MPKLPKTHYVLQILRQLIDGGPCEIESLVQDLGVSRRSIFRYLATLDQAGFKINRSDAQITLQVKNNPAGMEKFTNQEILLLEIILENMHRENGLLHMPIAESLRSKLMQRLPQLKGTPAAHKQRINIKSEPVTRVSGCHEIFEPVLNCILKEISMDCAYEPAHSGKNEKRQSFQFDPYELVFASHAWFVIGYRRDREQYRTLKMNRFEHARPTTRKFKRRNFSLDGYLKDAWRIIPDKPSMNVELIFAKEFADNIDETHWHSTQNTEWLEDGRLKFTCRVDGMNEIKWWILSMGPKCEVIAPEALRREVHRLASEAAEVNRC